MRMSRVILSGSLGVVMASGLANSALAKTYEESTFDSSNCTFSGSSGHYRVDCPAPSQCAYGGSWQEICDALGAIAVYTLNWPSDIVLENISCTNIGGGEALFTCTYNEGA
jgi:hypothetical protein